MHELSVALGIVRIADDELKKSGAERIDEIELEIGELSGVELDALDFVWSSAIKDTSLQNARRTTNVVPGFAKCIDCQTHYDIKQYFEPCPNCGSQLKGILKGRELRVKSLIVS